MMRWQNRVDIAKAFGYAESDIYETGLGLNILLMNLLKIQT